METEPKVCVVLPVYREPVSLIKRAADSILAQTYENFRVQLVLDDPQNEEAKSFLSEYCNQHEQFELHINPENLGLASSLNRAMSSIKQGLICRMDADDVSLPNRIERQVNYLLDHNLDLVGSYMNVLDEDGTFLYKVDSLPTSPAAISKALGYNNCVMHPTWLGKASIFQQGYRHMPLSEDYDFLLRAVASGAAIGNCPEILLNYTLSANSISRTNLYRQFLFQKVLTSRYQMNKKVSVEEAESIVDSEWTVEKESRYSNAYAVVNSFLGNKELCSRLLQIPALGSSLLKSPAYIRKLYRLAATQAISRMDPH